MTAWMFFAFTLDSMKMAGSLRSTRKSTQSIHIQHTGFRFGRHTLH